jgi:hypothetical protein
MRQINLNLLVLCYLASIAQPFLNFVGADKLQRDNMPTSRTLPSHLRAFVARAAPPKPSTITQLRERQIVESVNDINFVGIPPGLFF